MYLVIIQISHLIGGMSWKHHCTLARNHKLKLQKKVESYDNKAKNGHDDGNYGCREPD